ncbi:hypothetical protein Tco_1284669 [Tanacetum coccineum]
MYKSFMTFSKSVLDFQIKSLLYLLLLMKKLFHFIKELGYTGDIDFVTKVYTDHMHQPWRTFATVINKCLSRKTTGSLRFVFKSEEYQVYGALIPKEMSNRKMQDSTAYKTYLAFATGAATPKKARKLKKPASPPKKKTIVAVEEPSVSKKKALAKAERIKGIEMLSHAALLKEAQLKKAIKQSRQETNIHQAGGSSEGVDLELEVPDKPKGKSIDTNEGTSLKPGVPDVSKNDSSKSEYESWGDSNDDNDDDNQQSDDKRIESDDDTKLIRKSPSIRKMIRRDEFVHTQEDLYAEREGDRVKDDAQAIITAAFATQKTEVPLQSSSISSDYATKFLNFDNIPSGDIEIISMMDVKFKHEDPSIQTTPLLTVTVMTLINVDHSSDIRATVKSEVPTIVKEYLGTSLVDALHKALQRHTTELVKEHSVPADVTDHKALYHALIDSILEDEDAMDKGVADKLKKRKSDDANRDEGQPARPDQGLKRKKIGKETKPSKKAKSTRTSKGIIKSQPKSTGKSAQAEETVFETGDTQVPQNLGEDTGNTNEPPIVNVDPKDWTDLQDTQEALARVKSTSRIEIEECNKALNSSLDGITLTGDRYPIRLEETTTSGGSTGRTYTTSLTKIKDAKYDLKGIKDMGPKKQRFYGYASKRVSKHDVYSTKRILAVINVKVIIWYGYGHLEEIEVCRSDQQLYKFIEGDFYRLHLNDIKDILILVVPNRLFKLKGEDIMHLAAALRMFTRSIVNPNNSIEDLSLGNESYQKKLNISKPRTCDEDLSRRTPYTTLSDPQGVIYEDKLNKKRLMRSDELYKFSDGTLLIRFRYSFMTMATNLRMVYKQTMPTRI